MITKRVRIEHEWIEAKAEKMKLQLEVMKARRASIANPEARPTNDLLDRYGQVLKRCIQLDERFFALIGLDRYGERPVTHAE